MKSALFEKKEMLMANRREIGTYLVTFVPLPIDQANEENEAVYAHDCEQKFLDWLSEQRLDTQVEVDGVTVYGALLVTCSEQTAQMIMQAPNILQVVAEEDDDTSYEDM
jgi:hypothetical protein